MCSLFVGRSALWLRKYYTLENHSFYIKVYPYWLPQNTKNVIVKLVLVFSRLMAHFLKCLSRHHKQYHISENDQNIFLFQITWLQIHMITHKSRNGRGGAGSGEFNQRRHAPYAPASCRQRQRKPRKYATHHTRSGFRSRNGAWDTILVHFSHTGNAAVLYERTVRWPCRARANYVIFICQCRRRKVTNCPNKGVSLLAS